MCTAIARIAAKQATDTTTFIIWCFWKKWINEEGETQIFKALNQGIEDGLIVPSYFIKDGSESIQFSYQTIEKAKKTGKLFHPLNDGLIENWKKNLITKYSFTDKAHKIYLKQNTARIAAYKAYTPPFNYDSFGQSIWDDNGEMVLDVRGWGYIQKQENAEAIQDELGKIIVEALEFKWEMHNMGSL